MKKFRTLFPYHSETTLPDNIADLVEKTPHDGLRDSHRSLTGWAEISPGVRVMQVDGLTLLRYRASQRTADRSAVQRLLDERIEAITADGREVDINTSIAMSEQAEAEVIKYAPVKTQEAYVLISEKSRMIYVSGSTAKKCEDALSQLRRTLDGLDARPWGHCDLLTHAVTCSMSVNADKKKLHQLPDDITISAYGKVVVTGSDSSLKATFDGVQNDTAAVRGVIDGMFVRAVEMAHVDRSGPQIKSLADFELHMPASGNPHLKKYDYDDDSCAEDESAQAIAEMYLVDSYTKEILSSLAEFAHFAAGDQE